MKKILLFISVLILGAGLFAAWFVPNAFFGAPADTTVFVTLPEGLNVDSLATTLESKGIISSALAYSIFSKLDDTAVNFKPGDYQIAPGTSFRLIARQLALGPTRDEISITLIEGTTLDDWKVKLSEYGVSVKSSGDLVGDTRVKKSFPVDLAGQFVFLEDLPAGSSLEGYLFPDTYRVYKEQLPLGLVLKQLQQFGKKTDGYDAELKAQGRSWNELVTLASIVEKEGRGSEERKMIARIFLNRIKIGMRLQSDATVNYVTGAGRARPTLDDLEVDSLYNTYKNDGLPPGPICNPGSDALQAALHPADNDYFYYLHDADGKIYYAKTLEEHKANRYKAYGE